MTLITLDVMEVIVMGLLMQEVLLNQTEVEQVEGVQSVAPEEKVLLALEDLLLFMVQVLEEAEEAVEPQMVPVQTVVTGAFEFTINI